MPKIKSSEEIIIKSKMWRKHFYIRLYYNVKLQVYSGLYICIILYLYVLYYLYVLFCNLCTIMLQILML